MDYSKEGVHRKRFKNKARFSRVWNKLGVLVFRVAVAAAVIGVFAGAGIVVGAYMGIVERAPKLTEVMKPTKEKYTSIITDEKGVELERLDAGETREFASIDKIPAYLRYAFVAIEDERFFQHNGVDFRGTARAVYKSLTTDETQGGSTITQQLIKNKLKITRNSFITKFQEQYLATQYEKNMTEAYGSKEEAKDRILELYLNSIGLGYGQVGVQAAANRYFDKDVSDLTLAECAVMASITRNPTVWDPIRKQEKNNERKTAVLRKMYELGFITEDEREDALAEDVYSKIVEKQQKIEENTSYYSYYTDRVISEVKDALEDRLAYTSAEAYDLIYTGGIKIVAAIDTDMQAIVDEAFLNESLFPEEYAIEVQYTSSVKNTVTGKVKHWPMQREYVKTNEEADAFAESCRNRLLGADDDIEGERIFKIPQPQAGMAIIDYHNGKVRAIAGGRGEKLTNRALNRATDAARQPGSVFKVLASYAPALDMGLITAGTVIDDTPFTQGEYTPHNWYSNPKYLGLSTVRDGIMHSMNVLAVKNLYNTGVDNAFRYLKSFGFSTLSEDGDRNLPLALGGITNGVTQTEVAAAYGTIANGGVYNKPIFFTQVLDHDGNVILENNPAPRQVLKPTTAYILTDLMKSVINGGAMATGGRARFKDVKMPIAGKTGTTTDSRDLTFAGYTPYYVGAIYLGYDMPRATRSESSSYHLQLWSYVMEKIHADLEYKEFEQPNGLVRADICKDSGKLPIPGVCDSDPRGSRITKNEIFVGGTAPTEYCDVHQAVERVDIETGFAASDFCPPDNVRRVVGLVIRNRESDGEFIQDSQYVLSAMLTTGVLCPVHSMPPDIVIPGDDGEITDIPPIDPYDPTVVYPPPIELPNDGNGYVPPVVMPPSAPNVTPSSAPNGGGQYVPPVIDGGGQETAAPPAIVVPGGTIVMPPP